MDPRLSPAPQSETIINFGTDASLPYKLIKGFSGGETTHRWTDGIEAELSIPLLINDKRISQITFDTNALVTEKITQRLIVSAPGVETKTYEYNAANPSHKVYIDIPDNITGDLTINFKMPHACKVSEIDPSNTDTRLLAISFTNSSIFFNLQQLIDSYLKNDLTIAKYIQALTTPAQIHHVDQPSDFNVLEYLKEIAKHKCWKSQGGKALIFSKIPDGVSDINEKNPEKLADLIKVIVDRMNLSKGYLIHGARSAMTSEFYDMVLQFEKEGMNNHIYYLTLKAFSQKWNVELGLGIMVPRQKI